MNYYQATLYYKHHYRVSSSSYLVYSVYRKTIIRVCEGKENSNCNISENRGVTATHTHKEECGQRVPRLKKDLQRV